MSYTMTHLIIAHQYIKRHGIQSPEAGLFLLASISPDTVHASSHYDPSMKERSHFMPEDIRWGNIFKEEQMDRWYIELQKFYRSRYSSSLSSMEVAFLGGYTTHILVDIFNCKYFYSPNLIQYGLDVANFRMDYREQCIYQDQLLYQQYGVRENIFEQLAVGVDLLREYPILKHLDLENEINCDFIYDNLQDNERFYKAGKCEPGRKMSMITAEATNKFIQEMGKQCDELLFDLPVKKHLFEVKE